MNESRTAIEFIEIQGVHGHQTFPVYFHKGLNIIYGKNGSGKTTLMHVIANLLEKDIERFCYLTFEKIIVKTFGGAEITLIQIKGAERVIIKVLLNAELIGHVMQDEPTPAAIAALLKAHLGGRPVYLPAFRSILEGSQLNSRLQHYRESDDFKKEFEAISTREREFAMLNEKRTGPIERSHYESVAFKTVLCRRWFGKFVPVIRYPSLADVSREIAREQRDAQYRLALADQETLSTIFVQVLQTVLFPKPPSDKTPIDPEGALDSLKSKLGNLERQNLGLPHIYSKISELFQGSFQASDVSKTTISSVLKIYNEALSSRNELQDGLYSTLKLFSESVNRFLEGKRIIVTEHGEAPQSSIVELAGGRRASLTILSSGERHVLTLISAATHMTAFDGIVLIDEPELSLHIDWQRLILSEISKQAGDRQIIACTHSSEVAADHQERLIELAPFDWKANDLTFDFILEEDLDDEHNSLT